MDFDRHCAEIVAQTEQLTADVAGADLRASVPSCPGWTLGALLRHVGGGHRWAAEMVRTRSTSYLPDDQIRQVSGDDSGEVPAEWLTSGARDCAAAMREAGPSAPCWNPFGAGTATFLARRFANETLMHRADATLAAGTTFTAGEDVTLEAVDEWMDLDAEPAHFTLNPAKRDLLGPGRTLALAATDTPACWFVDLTGDVITWHRGRGEPTDTATAAVTVRGLAVDLLLMVYQRKGADDPALAVRGDDDLLALWRRHTAFG